MPVVDEGLIAVWEAFLRACDGDRGRVVRVLKGELPAPDGWAGWVAARQHARAEEGS